QANKVGSTSDAFLPGRSLTQERVLMWAHVAGSSPSNFADLRRRLCPRTARGGVLSAAEVSGRALCRLKAEREMHNAHPDRILVRLRPWSMGTPSYRYRRCWGDNLARAEHLTRDALSSREDYGELLAAGWRLW